MLGSRFARKNNRRRQIQKIAAARLEGLERRIKFSNVYHNLAGGSYLQDWSNTAAISSPDDWSGVPSIIGYRGDSVTGSLGVDPQTLLVPAIEPGDTPPGVI